MTHKFEPDTGVRFVYMLACSDGSFYVGKARNLVQDLHDHNIGKKKATKKRRPVTLVWATQTTKAEALTLQRKIKRMPKTQKYEIIQGQVRL